MSVSSICSTWSGDTTNQTLSGSGDVTITVADGTGATNDSLTIASATCTFRFGSLNLGSNAYVSGGNATFGGSGNNKSTIQWTANTRTLTITLGGPVGTFGQLNRPLVRVAGFEGKPVVGVKPSQAARLVSSRRRIRPRTHEIKQSCSERRQRQQIPAVVFEDSYQRPRVARPHEPKVPVRYLEAMDVIGPRGAQQPALERRQ